MSGSRFRSERVLALVVSILFLLASGLYYVIQRGKLGDTRLATDKTLLMTLAGLLLLLAVGLAWVMMRNLARVLAGRRRGLIGTRLQVRVALAFLLLVFIPSLTLFGGAIAIVSGTLESLVTPDLEETLDRDVELAAEIYQRARVKVHHFAPVLAVDLQRGALGSGSIAARGRLARELEQARERYDLFAAGFVPRDGSPVSVTSVDPRTEESVRPTEMGRLPSLVAEEVFETGRGTIAEDRLAYGWLAVAVEPVRSGKEVVGLVWAGEYIPEPLARQLERVMRTDDDIDAFQSRRPAVQRFYIVLFALLTMVVLFAAVWTGLFLARQITDPILELARGTRALARGELSYRVPSGADDEIGHLAKSFNRMAEDIEGQRETLDQRRRYIEILLETVPVGVVSLDATGRLTTANREAIRALRVESLEPGSSIEAALRTRAQVLDLVRPVLVGGVNRAEAEVEIDDHGDSVSIEVTAERFRISREEDGILIVLEDLTLLRRAERLAAWGEVARRVAHEIKNPLTPIRLAAERMRRRYRLDAGAASEAVEESVATIVREVVSLTSLVDEFSRFARLPEVRPRPGDVGRVVA
ncbi:MAG: HAMP domain-containing protein, partial [Acidobacteriota bacterium]|nr:HAMP domain-containing protein [Acidobacteriota bacterium]